MAVLYLGDCLEKMKCIADKSIDLIICDLPFGCLAIEKSVKPFGRNVKGPSNSGCSWDIKIDLEQFWKQIKRIRKNDHTPTLLFTTTKYGFDLYNSNPKEFRYDLVWDKGRGVSFLSANKMPMRSHEMIYVFSKAGAKYNRIDIDALGKVKRKDGESNTLRSDNMFGKGLKQSSGADKDKACIKSVIPIIKVGVKTQSHPTEKPIDLYKFLIERYSNKDDVVLDPTFGSGNSGLASKELNRKYIGIEKDNNFFWKFVGKLYNAIRSQESR
jgi:site-specific DNA-methyltransferase (adenine-specific)